MVLYPGQWLCTVTLVLGLVGIWVPATFATSMFNVAIDTTALVGSAAVLAFDLVDGDAVSNNMASLTAFSTDGTLGAAVADPAASVIGSLPGTTVLVDTAFFNELRQDLTLGTTLAFTLTLTEHFAGGPLPDQLAFFLLDVGQLPLFSTSDPTGDDALFTVDIDGTALGALAVFIATSGPAASARVTSVPEPGSLALVAIGMVGLAAYYRWRRKPTVR